MTTHAPVGNAPTPPSKRASRLAHGRWTPLWFLAPAVITLFAIGIYPTLFALVTSMRKYNLTRARCWVAR